MQEKISGPIGVIIIVVVLLGVVFFGWRYVQKASGGPDADATAASAKHWQEVSRQNEAKGPSQPSGNPQYPGGTMQGRNQSSGGGSAPPR